MTLETLLATLPTPPAAAPAEAAWASLMGETMGKIEALPAPTPALTACFSALIGLYARQEAGGNIAAQQVGDLKTEYRDPTGGKSLPQRASWLIRQYLGGTSLLYRGWPQ